MRDLGLNGARFDLDVGAIRCNFLWSRLGSLWYLPMLTLALAAWIKMHVGIAGHGCQFRVGEPGSYWLSCTIVCVVRVFVWQIAGRWLCELCRFRELVHRLNGFWVRHAVWGLRVCVFGGNGIVRVQCVGVSSGCAVWRLDFASGLYWD